MASYEIKQLLRHEPGRVLRSAPPRPSGEIHIADGGRADFDVAGSGTSETVGAAEAIAPDKIVFSPAANDDVERRRIFDLSRGPRWKRILRRLFRQPEPTPEELAELAEMQQRREHEQMLRDEAKIAIDRMVGSLNAANVCYRYPRSQRDLFISGVQSVYFDEARLHDDALYLHIDATRLPRGVLITKFLEQDLLTHLSMAVGRKVEAQYSPEEGMFLIVERGTGVRAIPLHVQYSDMIAKFPAYAGSLHFPIGLTTNRKPLYKSMEDAVHVLVAGETKGGKSNFLNMMIATLIQRNSPDRLKMVLVDLKGGVEMWPYQGIPHLITTIPGAEDGIIRHRENVVQVLEWVSTEGDRRLEVLRNKGYRDISNYNHAFFKKPMHRIMVVFDEFADIMLAPEIKKEAERLVANAVARFRAVGIHFVICTQYPSVNVITGQIKANLPLKVAFACATNGGSMVILNTGAAKGLKPVGRAVMQHKDGDIEIQTPFMPNEIIKEVIAAAKGEISVAVIEGKHDVTQEEILRWALEKENGALAVRRVYDAFKARGLTKDEVQIWLDKWESEQENFPLLVNGKIYRIERVGKNHVRTLVDPDKNPQKSDADNNSD